MTFSLRLIQRLMGVLMIALPQEPEKQIGRIGTGPDTADLLSD